jgi:hypothetical protein
MPNATAAAVPFSRLRGITVKAVAIIAKPATTGAIWVKVGHLSNLPSLRLAGIIIQNGPLNANSISAPARAEGTYRRSK